MTQATPHPPWFDPAMPGRERCVLSCMLERWATKRPDREFLRFEDGSSWSFGRTRSVARSAAAGLRLVGVRPGDRVLGWLPNGPDVVRSWFGTNLLGACFVPLNLAYRGRLLAHAIEQSSARIMIVHRNLIERLRDIPVGGIETLIVVGGPAGDLQWPGRVFGTDILDTADDGVPDAPAEPWDPEIVIFTSGTTGPSKGVLCSYLQMYCTGGVQYGYMTPDDRMIIDLPMFHVGGVSAITGGLITGATLALHESFSTERFWERVRGFGATTTSGLIGSMAAFLSTAPPRDDDADNPLRMIVGALTPLTISIARRYGFHYCSGFNMTELSAPLFTVVDAPQPGSCGRPRTGCECRIVDEHDIECPPGVAGELIVRYDLPWMTMLGYLNQPEATARAWRNGWFHTGDLLYRDENGDFHFVDRLKDAIRRRGENISSIEVETELYAFPGVAEAAAVGVPSEHGEEEVLVAVVARADAPAMDPGQLVRFLIPRMPHYMVPRYVRVLDALPKTPTNKIQKVELRRQGVTADTWDRVAHGIEVKRERFVP